MSHDIGDEMTTRLATLGPTRLEVLDESEQHRGHGGWREGGETHFRIDIVSQAFAGKSRVERHRLVNAVLDDAFKRGLHALAVRARTPAEAEAAGVAFTLARPNDRIREILAISHYDRIIRVSDTLEG